ncbi:unnamed protein product [Medioppia subpectinata]|uniref:HTH La-type RNA-binding domain-containing protein n=1 Tax=Medioppia subpectinata TaxID=1979941 RepID=A0A7R9KC08_9ACAR|nr:unnamed protein product [Medioppia subpectinata]CAG2100650.1 unnamed protein product [Medioppia subpectinata]
MTAAKSTWTEVMDQLEYYFSDINLMNDHFMRSAAKKDDGWLSLDTLMRFKRLNGLVDNSADALTAALEKSRSDWFEVNAANDKVRRRPTKPLPQVSDQLTASLDERTLFVTGFPPKTTADELIHWSKQFAGVLSVRPNRLKTSRLFDGTVSVIFTDKSMADKMRAQSGVAFNGHELAVETKLEHNFRQKALIPKHGNNGSKGTVGPTTNGHTDSEAKKGTNPIVVKLIGLKRSVSVDRIKKCLSLYGRVVYVGRHPTGYCLAHFADRSDGLRLLADSIGPTAEDAKGVTGHKVCIAKNEVTAQLLTEEEEKQFWSVMVEKTVRHNRLRKQANEHKKRKRSVSHTVVDSAKRLAQS